MYQITYWTNNEPVAYDCLFQSLWAAVDGARAVTENERFSTVVTNTLTGEIIVEFEPESQKAIYIACHVPENVKQLALSPIE